MMSEAKIDHTIVDAKIINAPCSTKNQSKARDSEMRGGTRGSPNGNGRNRRKSSVRAKFEHTFLIIKRTLGFAKVQLSRHGRTASPV